MNNELKQILNHKELEITNKLVLDIQKTHPNLEKLCLMQVLSDIANKCMFVIGASGSGKSVSQKWLEKQIQRQVIKFHAIGISSFKAYNERLQAEPTTILIEDLSVAKTKDIMVKTAFFLAHLTYDKKLVRPIQPFPIEIYQFLGSTIIALQPYILKQLVVETEFETDIRDKAIRFYHLRMPLEEKLQPPSVLPNAHIKYKYINEIQTKINPNIKKTKLYKKTLFNFMHEFTEGRAREHLEDYLKAITILNERTEITIQDLQLLEFLSRNFKVELEVFQKEHLEGERYINPDVLPILALLSTYKQYKIDSLMLHFQVKKTRIYEILNNVSEYVMAVSSKSTIVPTKYTMELLKDIGEW